MGTNNSKINTNDPNCNEKCQNNRELKTLENNFKRYSLVRNTINQNINEVKGKIDLMKHGEKRLNNIIIRTKNIDLNKKIRNFKIIFNQLIKELNTRIHIHNVQFKFKLKNNIIVRDLEKKIKNQDTSIRKNNMLIEKEKRLLEDTVKKNKYLDYLNNIKKILFGILLLFLVILIGFIIYKKYKKD